MKKLILLVLLLFIVISPILAEAYIYQKGESYLVMSETTTQLSKSKMQTSYRYTLVNVYDLRMFLKKYNTKSYQLVDTQTTALTASVTQKVYTIQISK
jgi:hypothetical protein